MWLYTRMYVYVVCCLTVCHATHVITELIAHSTTPLQPVALRPEPVSGGSAKRIVSAYVMNSRNGVVI